MNIVPEMSDRVREAPHATTTDRRRKAVINLLNEKAANTCEYLDLLIESDMRHTAPHTLPEAITPAPAPTEEPKEAPETTGTRDSEIPVTTPKIRVSRDPRLRNKTEQPPYCKQTAAACNCLGSSLWYHVLFSLLEYVFDLLW